MTDKSSSNAFRDAIVAVYTNNATLQCVKNMFGVPEDQVEIALKYLTRLNKIRSDDGQLPLQENEERKQVYRWASKYAGASVNDITTEYEKKHALILDAQGHKLADIYEEYGVSSFCHRSHQKELARAMGKKNMKEVRVAIKEKKASIELVESAIFHNILFQKRGKPLLFDQDSARIIVDSVRNVGKSRISSNAVATKIEDVVLYLTDTLEWEVKPPTKQDSKLKRARRMLKRLMK